MLRYPGLLVLVTSCAAPPAANAPPEASPPRPATVVVPQPGPAEETSANPLDAQSRVHEQEVERPRGEASDADDAAFVLSIPKGGRLILGHEVLQDLEDLRARAAEVARTRPEQMVTIKADAGTEYRRIVEAMDAVQRGGLTNIVFSTHQSTKGAPPTPP